MPKRRVTSLKRRSITCKYLTYKFGSGINSKFIQLPLVHVYLKSGVRHVRTDALVDSGATSTFVPSELAELLGLTKLQDASATGAGGSFATWITRLDLLSIIKEEVFDTFRNVVVHVPKQEGVIPYMRLGRDTVFKHFDITFHENKEEITFTRS